MAEGENKIEIGVEAVGADTAAENLDKVGAASGRVADSVSAGNEKLDAAKASSEAFDVELKKLEETFQRVATAAEKLQDLPLDQQIVEIGKIKAELETARDGFVKLGDDGKVAVEQLNVQIGALDQKLSAVQAEATKTRNVLGNMPEGVKTSFLAAQKAVDDFFTRMERGRITERDMKRLWITQENLRHEIEKSGVAIESFGAEGKAALDGLNKRVEEANGHFRRLDDSVDAGRRSVADTKEQWVGLEQAMARVLGKHGEIIIQAAIAIGAIKQIWSVWKQVEEATGQNERGVMTLTKAIEAAGTAAKAWGLDFQNSLANVLAGMENVALASTKTGDSTQTFGQAVKDLDVSIVQMVVSATGGKDALDFLNAALANGVDQSTAMQMALWQVKEAEDAYELALRKGPEATALWVEAMAASKDGRDALKKSMEDLLPVLDALKTKEDLAAEAARLHAANTKILDDATKLYNTSAKERIGVDQTYYEELAKLKGAQEENSFALEQYAQIVAEMLPDAERQSVAIEKTAQKMDALLKNTDGLTDAERKHIQSIIDRIKKIDELSAADKQKLEQDLARVGHEKEIAAAHAVTMKTVTDAAGNTKVVIENLAAKQDALNTSVEDGRTKYDNFGTGLKTADGQIESTAGALARLYKAQGDTKSFEDAEKGIRQLTTAYVDQATALDGLIQKLNDAKESAIALSLINVDEGEE